MTSTPYLSCLPSLVYDSCSSDCCHNQHDRVTEHDESTGSSEDWSDQRLWLWSGWKLMMEEGQKVGRSKSSEDRVLDHGASPNNRKQPARRHDCWRFFLLFCLPAACTPPLFPMHMWRWGCAACPELTSLRDIQAAARLIDGQLQIWQHHESSTVDTFRRILSTKSAAAKPCLRKWPTTTDDDWRRRGPQKVGLDVAIEHRVAL